MIKKILIANRGEIALRIMATAKKMGIATVTMYTEEEKNLPHVLKSDEAIFLGKGPLKDTYLNQEKIIEIAKLTNSDAIHPGYGFLSEKAEFAKKVKENGIIFIGPNYEAIEMMGDKKTSKIIIEKLNVPAIPGYHGDNQDPQFLKNKAMEIGTPLLIKASAGGGGKGMRIVENIEEFDVLLEGAKREALNAFGDQTVLLEKYITSPRHIEIQVLSDSHGNHFHLNERECSIQRRYQKIIEEAPSIAVNEELREKMTSAALLITKGINYLGVGTVELILDTDGKFYFLEMNTRLQVEHPVTEMITGLDLVQLQIQVANGEKLNFTQKDIQKNGHAIEARIYAEDPDNEFLPTLGKILKIGNLSQVETRLDCGYLEGNEVLISFDPMLAKLIAFGKSRELAILKLKQALIEVSFLGVKTNRNYINRILNSKKFQIGETYTHFVKTNESDLKPNSAHEDHFLFAIASFLFLSKNSNEEKSPWNSLQNFRLNIDSTVQFDLILNSQNIMINLLESKSEMEIKLIFEKKNYEFEIIEIGKKSLLLKNESITKRIFFVNSFFEIDCESFEIKNRESGLFLDKKSSQFDGQMKSPMPGKILKILVSKDQIVEKGTAILIMEAMKMEHTIKASMNGKIEALLYKEGDQVKGGVELFKLCQI